MLASRAHGIYYLELSAAYGDLRACYRGGGGVDYCALASARAVIQSGLAVLLFIESTLYYIPYIHALQNDIVFTISWDTINMCVVLVNC